jgi:SAM-dependent methyltransferase
MKFVDYKKNFWDTGHADAGNPNNYVTDLSMQEFCRYHNVSTPEHQSITDIGIGYGQLVYELSMNHNTVYAVDISSVALERIKPYCAKTYLSQELSQVPPVDLAISHLVFQHNPEDEIFRIINEVNLKSGGGFTFQIATLNVQKSILQPVIMEDLNKGMLHFYSPAKIAEIIQATNKQLIYVSDPIWHDAPYSFEWYIMKVANK